MKTKQLTPRQLKVGEQIKHILSSVLQLKKVQDPVLDAYIVTITQVKMSADLKLANCYFSILGKDDYKLLQDALNYNAKYIRGLCSKELRSLKYIPSFRFYYDDSFDNFTKIDNILKSIKSGNENIDK